MENEYFNLTLRVSEIKLSNFRGFTELNVEFNSELTVFCGVNGGGKTTILDATASLLQFWVDALQGTAKDKLDIFSNDDIHNGTLEANNGITVKVNERSMLNELIAVGAEPKPQYIDNNESVHTWYAALSKAQTGYETDTVDDLGLRELDSIRKRLRQAILNPNALISLPVIVYYSCTNVPKHYEIKPEFYDYQLFSIYNDSLLNDAFNYTSFYKWFEWQYNKSGHQLQNNSLLNTVAEALYALLSDDENKYHNLHINFDSPKGELMIDKNNTRLKVSQFSSGEKSIFSLVADLAKRLVIANPNQQAPLRGGGVVLVDEIDLHLHPRWQRKIVPKLRDIFPNIQWVITTHSPQVLSEVSKDNAVIVRQNGIESLYTQIKWLDTNAILASVFDTDIRPKEAQAKLECLADLIERKKFAEAQLLLNELKTLWGENNSDVVHYSFLLNYSM